MARRKETVYEKLLRLHAKLGGDTEALKASISPTEIGPEAERRVSLEAESALYYVAVKGTNFKPKDCKWCEREFLVVDFIPVAYCSDKCRAEALSKIGIPWNPHGADDYSRWGMYGKLKIPKIIGVEATQSLKDSGNYFPENHKK